MDNKGIYIDLCGKERSIPIYSKPFWMNAVCGEENWDVLLYRKGEEMLGALPYYIKRNFNVSYITQPSFTQYNGIWIKYHHMQQYAKRLSF